MPFRNSISFPPTVSTAALITNATNQSLTNATVTTVSFATIETLTGGDLTASVAGNSITTVNPGVYALHGSCSFVTATGNTRRIVQIAVSSVVQCRLEIGAPTTAAPWSGEVNTQIALAAGAVITLQAYHASGAALTLSNSNYPARLAVYRVG